jgi:hypothetical protein
MKAIPTRLMIACALAALGSCADLKPTTAEAPKKDEAKTQEKPEAPKLIGRVASIPADKRFVLIQSYGKWSVETGAILTTRGPDDRSANLLATGESLGEFAAADLQSGLVEVGDAVYSRHVPQPPPLLTTPESPQGQAIAPPENVQKNN